MTGQAQIRINNLLKIYRLLFSGPLTKHCLMEQSGLSLMSMTNLINRLTEYGAVQCVPETGASKTTGRKAFQVVLDTEDPVWMVMDLRNTDLFCALFSADRRIRETKTFSGSGYEESFGSFLQYVE